MLVPEPVPGREAQIVGTESLTVRARPTLHRVGAVWTWTPEFGIYALVREVGMGRLSRAAMLLGIAMSWASTVSGTIISDPGCCACVGMGPQAFACAELTTRIEEVEFQNQCDAVGGTVKCFFTAQSEGLEPPPNCIARLEETGVNCPIKNGAPIASAPALGALALACAAVGIWKVRRRSNALRS